MDVMVIGEIRKLLEEYIDYDIGRKLRELLHQLAIENYEPQHTPEQYLKFMNTYDCSFSVNSAQSMNHPYYYTLFSEKTQHVLGDSIEMCLDSGMMGRSR